MKLTTVSIPAVEMTLDEQHTFWHAWRSTVVLIEGKKIVDWDTDDGNNAILLAGETSYRAVRLREK
jgi:hypothetical protein